MKTQKGFAGIASLIAVVVAIIIGGAYVVMRQEAQAPASDFNFTPPATTTVPAPSNQTDLSVFKKVNYTLECPGKCSYRSVGLADPVIKAVDNNYGVTVLHAYDADVQTSPQFNFLVLVGNLNSQPKQFAVSEIDLHPDLKGWSYIDSLGYKSIIWPQVKSISLSGGVVTVTVFSPSTEETKVIKYQIIDNKLSVVSGQTSTSSDQTAGWKTYRNDQYGFEFRYPVNAVVEQGDPKSPEEVVTLKYKEGGSMDVAIMDRVFDPGNIQSFDGTLKYPNPRKIGEKIAYSYSYGDVGCSAQFNLTDLGQKTIQVRFSACEGELFPSASSQDQILSTLKFTK